MKYLKHFENYSDNIFDIIIKSNKNVFITNFKYGSNVFGKLTRALSRNNKTFEAVRYLEHFKPNENKYIFNLDYLIFDVDDFENLKNLSELINLFSNTNVKIIVLSAYYKIEGLDLEIIELNKLKDITGSVMKKINENNISNSNNWTERTVDIPRKDFFDKWFIDKVFIEDQGDYELYSYHDKNWDEKEQEYFWETKKLLKVDKREDITHYWEKDIINRPLYKVRHKDMTREQELKIRSWCGTEKNPKYTSKYEGFEKGLAKFRSFLSDKQNGKLYHVLPDGNIVEMLPDESTEKYKREIIDYLLDTSNLDLIDHVNT
jgi:hypothetical protein